MVGNGALLLQLSVLLLEQLFKVLLFTCLCLSSADLSLDSRSLWALLWLQRKYIQSINIQELLAD